MLFYTPKRPYYLVDETRWLVVAYPWTLPLLHVGKPANGLNPPTRLPRRNRMRLINELKIGHVKNMFKRGEKKGRYKRKPTVNVNETNEWFKQLRWPLPLSRACATNWGDGKAYGDGSWRVTSWMELRPGAKGYRTRRRSAQKHYLKIDQIATSTTLN